MGENELKALRIAADGGIHYDRARYRGKDGKALSFGGFQTLYVLSDRKLIAGVGKHWSVDRWDATDLGRRWLAEHGHGG